jgi:hypothetical protein
MRDTDIVLRAREIPQHLPRHRPSSPIRPLRAWGSCFSLSLRYVGAQGAVGLPGWQQWLGVAVQSRVGNSAASAGEVADMFGESSCINYNYWVPRIGQGKSTHRPSSVEQQTDQRLERTSPA